MGTSRLTRSRSKRVNEETSGSKISRPRSSTTSPSMRSQTSSVRTATATSSVARRCATVRSRNDGCQVSSSSWMATNSASTVPTPWLEAASMPRLTGLCSTVTRPVRLGHCTTSRSTSAASPPSSTTTACQAGNVCPQTSASARASSSGRSLVRMTTATAGRSCPPPLIGVPARSGGELADGVLPAGLLPRVAGLVDLGEGDGAVGVDEERPAQRHAGLLVEDAVGLRGRPVRPEVREQRELEALLLAEGLEAEHRVGADRQHPHAGVGVGGQLVAQLAQLTGADAGEREGVEDQQDRGAPQLREGDDLLVLVGEAEFGRGVADGDGHATDR